MRPMTTTTTVEAAVETGMVEVTTRETPAETTMMKVTMMKEPKPEPYGNAVDVIRQ